MPPAARLFDLHTCPALSPNPHVGGPIIPMVSKNVIIGFLPAARIFDKCFCPGPPDIIIQGAATVLINGQNAARVFDKTAHGGVIVTGMPNVLVGDRGGTVTVPLPEGSLTSLGAKINKKLNQAADKKKAAREIVDGLTPEQIKNLPPAVRNRLMRTLLEGGADDADKAALKKIYAVKFVDPGFEKRDAEKRKKLVDALKNDKDIVDAKKNWATMSAEDRSKIMQKVADHQAAAYGTKPTVINFFDKPAKDGLVTEGYYNHGDGKLNINTNPDSSFDDFDEAVATVTHENAHKYQSELADQVKDGTLKPGDPDYDQAETFAANDEYYTNDQPEYFTQPMENHSRTLEDDIRKAIP